MGCGVTVWGNGIECGVTLLDIGLYHGVLCIMQSTYKGEKMENPKKIYIADDEDSIRSAIKAFLENAGFEVHDFATGDLLLEVFGKSPADLVVLDVMMPGSNGFTVCKALRAVSTVPIIMLTARDSDLDYATGLDIGSDDYLIKPFSPIALVKRIEAIFRRISFERGDK